MDKTFDPSRVETRLYQMWETSGYFKPNTQEGRDPYCIMIPPPNVTGSLHLGHAFQHTLMDALIRYQRMQGKNTLWQVGTDHAGIATQMVVERKLSAQEGKSRHDYGRDGFIKKIWEWKQESGSQITQQMRRLGNSVDWERERFTMDEGLSRAVREVFVRLHDDGLMYRGKRLVNWDPTLQTAISDLEVENQEKQGSMWYVRYPLANGATTDDGKDYVIIATTRPETMLGDVAVMVHPDDPRYASLIGQQVALPLCQRLIPIISDEHVDMSLGTGCVKVTPAHDFNDYEVGQRHQLPLITIFNADATICAQATVFDNAGQPITTEAKIPPAYQNQDRYQVRKTLVQDLDAHGLLEKITPHTLTLPMGDRSGVVIEPMLMDQWYVRVAPLAEKAVEAVRNGAISFVPKSYENMFFAWMQDVQDWCVSRQLWWGHRIPAWYDTQGNIYVGRDESEVRSKYQIDASVSLSQDDDVLDTWFSSALWTFSTLGWPDKTPELATYHPTNVLISGFDIIFFWIARMIMMTLYVIKDEQGQAQIPFEHIYITGLIRDEEGQKMSKSKGNVLDPMDMIDGITLEDLIAKRTTNMMQPHLAEKIATRTRRQFPEGIKAYGTDALRFTLTSMASASRDLNWDMGRLEGSRNFCNKLWNASRYVLSNLQPASCETPTPTAQHSLADRWILTRLQECIDHVHRSFTQYRFDLAAQTIYDFVWHQFCDWYLELTKPILWQGEVGQQQAARDTLAHVLETILRLAHPIIPFVTEEIWQQAAPILLKERQPSLMLMPYPIADPQQIDTTALQAQDWLNQLIMAVRNLRAETSVSPGKPLCILLKANAQDQQHIQNSHMVLSHIAKLEDITFLEEGEHIPPAASARVGSTEVFLPLAGILDIDVELRRLEKDASQLTHAIQSLESKLSNANFVNKAPTAVVDKTKQQLDAQRQALAKVRKQQEQLQTCQ